MSSQSNKVVAHVPHRFKSGCLAAFRNRLSLRWIRRYALGLGAFGVGLLVGTSAAYADCSRERVTVIGDPDERDRACVALSDVSSTFVMEEIKYSTALPLELSTPQATPVMSTPG